MIFPLHTRNLTAEVFTGLPMLTAKGSPKRGFCAGLKCSSLGWVHAAPNVISGSSVWKDGLMFLRVPKHWWWNKVRPVPKIRSKMNSAGPPANCPRPYSSGQACQGLPGMTQERVTMGDPIPSKLLQNRSSVLKQADSSKTCQHFFMGIKILKETILHSSTSGVKPRR